MAHFQMSRSVEIERPPEAVNQYVTDLSNASAWRPNLSVRDFSGDPLAVSTSGRDVTTFMGREMVVDVEVTELEADRGFEMRQEGGAYTGSATWDFSPGPGNGCTATLSFEGEMSVWMAGLASGLIRGQAEKAMKRDLANLKANLEASASDPNRE